MLPYEDDGAAAADGDPYELLLPDEMELPLDTDELPYEDEGAAGAAGDPYELLLPEELPLDGLL